MTDEPLAYRALLGTDGINSLGEKLSPEALRKIADDLNAANMVPPVLFADGSEEAQLRSHLHGRAFMEGVSLGIEGLYWDAVMKQSKDNNMTNDDNIDPTPAHIVDLTPHHVADLTPHHVVDFAPHYHAGPVEDITRDFTPAVNVTISKGTRGFTPRTKPTPIRPEVEQPQPEPNHANILERMKRIIGRTSHTSDPRQSGKVGPRNTDKL